MRYFIACTANIATGGTELLHQLSWSLSARGVENYMLYYDVNLISSPTPDAFMKYQTKYVTSFVDDENSVLICPEVLIHILDICTRGVVVIWWLSVDNYIKSYCGCVETMNQLITYDASGCRKNLLHFVQSKYAEEFVKRNYLTNDQEVPYLTDYINDEIVSAGKMYRGQFVREDIVLYNPKKGAENLQKLMEKCRTDIRWIPLKGFTPVQMAMLMCKAKVYIDFGNHPGKDRIPREAAICGCCIITNREGSAAYNEDVGIPEKYKVSDMQDNEYILEMLYDLTDNYDQRIGQYESYVASIMQERDRFEKEVDNMLQIVNRGRHISRQIHLNQNEYDSISLSMENVVSKINELYEQFRENCTQNEIENAVKALLNIEYLLSMLRETNYMVIKNVLTYKETRETQ